MIVRDAYRHSQKIAGTVDMSPRRKARVVVMVVTVILEPMSSIV